MEINFHLTLYFSVFSIFVNRTIKKKLLNQKLISASCYFPKELLLKYFRRYNVSQSCSEWNDVVPLCYKYRN